jgi:hypothetical protein
MSDPAGDQWGMVEILVGQAIAWPEVWFEIWRKFAIAIGIGTMTRDELAVLIAWMAFAHGRSRKWIYSIYQWANV